MKFFKLLCAQEDPVDVKQSIASVCLNVWFLVFFPSKIPNSGIRAGLGSLKVTKKLKGGVVAVVYLLQQSEGSVKKILRYLSKFFCYC